jgi:hypothetical protein
MYVTVHKVGEGTRAGEHFYKAAASIGGEGEIGGGLTAASPTRARGTVVRLAGLDSEASQPPGCQR